MQQILIIHGGEVFETHEEYIQSLKDKTITLERLRLKDWKRHLQEDLGDSYEVLTPRLPNAQNARYAEWKIIFEKYIPLLSDNVIFIGHSLGALFFVKYLSENKYPKPILATMLVAAPYNTEKRHPLADFTIDEDLSKLESQGGKLFLYHSTDDMVVRYKNVELYKEQLPDATLRVFEDRGHFNMEHLPEIVTDIHELSPSS